MKLEQQNGQVDWGQQGVIMPVNEFIRREFIRTCVEDVVPIATIKTFPNQKPWIDGSILVKLKARTTAFNQGKVTGNMTK